MRLTLLTGENRRNTYASVFLLLTIGVYHWNTDPEVCGGDPIVSHHRSAPKLLASNTQLVSATSDSLTTVQTASIQQAHNEVTITEATSTTPGEKSAEPAPTAHEEVQLPEGTALSGRGALQASQSLLERGKLILEKTADYSVQFRRHERINGELLPPQAMNLKVRHEPFSLYMKWTEGDKGRQLIFVEGQNEGHVLVQPGGLTGRLTGALSMAPDDNRVMSESRYPATCAGLLELTKIILNHHQHDLKRDAGVTTEIRDGESFDERPCYLTTLVYENPTINPEYHKSLILIDKELSVPVHVRNYTWIEGQAPTTLDESCLIESYSFTGLEINTQLTNNDFEKSKYKMR